MNIKTKISDNCYYIGIIASLGVALFVVSVYGINTIYYVVGLMA